MSCLAKSSDFVYLIHFHVYRKLNLTYERLPVRLHEVHVGYEPGLRVTYRRYVDCVTGE